MQRRRNWRLRKIWCVWMFDRWRTTSCFLSMSVLISGYGLTNKRTDIIHDVHKGLLKHKTENCFSYHLGYCFVLLHELYPTFPFRVPRRPGNFAWMKSRTENEWRCVGFKERPGVIEHFKPKIICAVTLFIFVIILIIILCIFAPTPQHATIQ